MSAVLQFPKVAEVCRCGRVAPILVMARRRPGRRPYRHLTRGVTHAYVCDSARCRKNAHARLDYGTRPRGPR
jgi:hypothetical protein